MKKLFIILLAAFAMTANAQSKFGYMSYREVVTALPEYAKVQADLQDLRSKCEAEIAQSDKEFNKRYTAFIDGQNTFPDVIRTKRQKELQELMEHSIAFKKEVEKTIADARRELMQSLNEKVNMAVKAVCVEDGFDYILNTDRDAYLYINEANGTDITARVKALLGITVTAAE